MRKINMQDPRARRNTFAAAVILILMLLGTGFLFISVDWGTGTGLFLAGMALLGSADASASSPLQ
jgi:hypothetical protein